MKRIATILALCMLLAAPGALAAEEGFFSRIMNLFRGDTPAQAPGPAPEAAPAAQGAGDGGSAGGNAVGSPGTTNGVGGDTGPPDNACNACATVVCEGSRYEPQSDIQTDLFVCPGRLPDCRNVYGNCRIIGCAAPVGCTERAHTCYDYSDAQAPPIGRVTNPPAQPQAVQDTPTVDSGETAPQAPIRCEGTYEECVAKYNVCSCGWKDPAAPQ